MNAHQPHGIFVRDRRNFRFNFRLALRLDEFQKTEQSLPLKLVELLREIQKPLECSRARCAPRGRVRSQSA